MNLNATQIMFFGVFGVIVVMLFKDHATWLFSYIAANAAKIKRPQESPPPAPIPEAPLLASVREFNEFKSTLAGTPAAAKLEEVFPLLLESSNNQEDKVVTAVKQFNILKKSLAGTTAEDKLDEVFPFLLKQEPKNAK